MHIYGIFLCLLLVEESVPSPQYKTERPPYEDFLNYGIKRLKPDRDLENEIIKSKVDVLGDVLKKHVNKLRKSPGQIVELVFLVDSSASVGAENFFNELKFVKKLLADFTVSYNQTRVAVITFSSRTKVIRHIDHVTQASPDNHKCSLLERELPRIGYSGGGTYTLGALMEAQSVLAISRKDAVKAVFLVTDGYSNGGDPRPAAEFLKSRGVIVFTFGIQNGNVKELYDMASTPKEEHSYILNSFQEFEALARRALHEDLHSGRMISQDSAACSTLCDERDECCDEYARCTCGTHTGHYACTCRIGFYGTGLKGDCRPCPSGTYRDVEGPSDVTGCKPCPDPHMLSPKGSTSAHQCYCNRGYTQSGMQCQRLKCPQLTPPPNGYFVRGTCERAVNAACGIRCRPGYSLEGSSIRLCREDGIWSGGDAICVMKTCKMLKPPVKGDMICSSETGTIDTQCHFTCKPGYQLVGSRRRTCLAVAMWDGIRAYCKPIFCPPLPANKNGFIKPESCAVGKIKYGTRCQFGCNPGYELSGPLKTTCTDKGMWSEGNQKVRCIDVEAPILKCPRNKEVNTEPNENYALVEWEQPFVSDSSKGRVYITTVPATKQPMKLKIGQHSITFIAKDEWGNKAKCVFNIRVKDNEPPKIDLCESPPTFLSRDVEVDVYWEEPIFSDNSGAHVQVERSKEPGRFPQGKTVVEYSAFDQQGNVASCNITINVQQHACEMPVDPINGVANCTENPEAVYCSLTCESGYAFAMRPSQDYFCSYDGVWLPDSNPFPFPECSVSSISNTIYHSGEIAMEEEDDGSVCDDIFFMGQVENKIQMKLENALSQVCVDDLLCEIETVEAVCEGLLAEAEEEFNSVGFFRKKRDINQDDYIKRYWPFSDDEDSKWVYWKRGQPLNSIFNGRAKRHVPLEAHVKRQFNFPSRIFQTKEINDTIARKKSENDANFMGVLTRLIVQSLGKDIGMTRFSSFLTNLGNKEENLGVNDFLAAFSKEFGEEKAKDLRSLAEQRLGPILSDNLSEEAVTIRKGIHFSSSSVSKFGGVIQMMNGPHEGEDSDQQADDAAAIYQAEPLQSAQPHQKEKGLKVKFKVEGRGEGASDILSNAFKDILESANTGVFDIDFGERQIKVAAIRLSEDPEYKCDPGSVLVDRLCVKCPVGTFFNVIVKECQSCPAGSYQPEEGQVSCLICPENTSTKAGQAKSGEECKAMCLPGSYSKDALEPCITCSLGEYQDEYASKECSPCPHETTTWRRGSWVIEECKPPCPPGHVSETGLQPCLPCPRGYFQSESGQKDCFKCPDEFLTANRSSVSLLDCIGVVDNSQAAYTSLEKLPINDCFSSPCLNGGSCMSVESGYVCRCPLGYTGQHCESELDECLSFPCLNNGTCVDKLEGFTCECVKGYQGHLCDVNIDDCHPNPCQNDATCVDLVNGFNCICDSGFTGETCETNIDECEIATCANGSTCVDGISDYTCICPPGFEGRHCNEDVDECDSSPCLHGECSDLVNDYRCKCEPGYVGKDCAVDENDCLSEPCQNSGTCTDWINGFSCLCLPGFTGRICETKMSADFTLEFPDSGIINYASVENLPRDLDEATLCFWMKTKDKENYGTPFSYATENHDNAFTLTDYSGFVLYVNGEKRITDVSANDGQWHLICAVWKATGGRWALFKDGTRVDSGKGLSDGKSIQRKGTLVIGQEQDKRGGSYSEPESFIGQITLLNVWGRALLPSEISTFVNNCSRYDGDSKSWPDFQEGIMGRVSLRSSPFCSGCGVAPTPPNGKLVNPGSYPGHVIRVECNEGYKLYSGDRERTCLVHGIWSGIEPECRPISCGFPGHLRNGEMKGGFTYDYGDTLHLSCNKGFRLIGNSSRTCQADGKWSGEKPECQRIKCPNPKPMENRVLISHLGSYLPTNKVAYSCEKGYQMDGPAFQTCGSGGNWEGDSPTCQPKSCSEVPRIPHGTATKNVNGFSASVECKKGYKLKKISLSEIKCIDGKWTKPFPKCVKAECEKPPPVANGNVKIRVSMKGKQAKYKCNTGYVLQGPSLITCTEDGTWDSPEWSQCVPQPCPFPEIPTHGKTPDKEKWSVGDEIIHECEEGFLIKGKPSRVCVKGFDEGYWKGETPSCQPISCPSLNSIDGGTYAILQSGTIDSDVLSVMDEIELLARRRRSPSEFGFPSIGSNNYEDLEDFGQSPAEEISFPKPSFGGFDYGQTQSGFDYGGQRSGDFDYIGQTAGFDYVGQTPGEFDEFGQTPGGLDYVGQTSGGFDGFDQSPDGLDVFSEFPSQNSFSQSSGFDFDYSQTPDSLILDSYTYNTIVEYDCRPGFKLIGSRTRRCSENGDWDEPEPRCYEQHCSQLKPLKDGYMTYFGSGINSRVEFSCNKGFRLEGDFEILCQSNRNWLGDIPSCQPLTCGIPVQPENGTVEYTSTSFGAMATYDCYQGFVLEGSFTRYCGEGGFWNGSLPRCIGVVCKTPSVIDKGYIYYEGNLNVGSIVEYGCNDCYKLIGTDYRECELDESWSLEEPRCELIMCEKLPSELENGKVIGDSNSCGSLVEYECDPGYEMKGQRKASCMDDGKWTSPPAKCQKVSCGTPPLLKYAKFIGSSFLFSDQIEYECNEGYTLNGNNLLTCSENKKWVGEVPKCNIVYCTKPKGPSNGRVRVSGLFYGASVKIVCDPGFKLQGDSYLTCQANGSWDKDMPFCAPIICPPAPLPSHASYNSTELYFESFTHLYYKCDEGYVTTSQDTTLKCNSKGLWEGKVIQCNPVDCGYPGDLQFGKVEGEKFTLGNIVSFQCFEGYELIGESKAACKSDGSWDDIPTCKRINCGPPATISHGKVIADEPEGDFNTSVHYECKKGYILDGNSNIICQEDGSWSGDVPTCSSVLCPEPPEGLNADILGGIYEYDHSISFLCYDGFYLRGAPYLTCQEDGTWSDEFPVCEMIACGIPEDVSNAKWNTKKLSDIPAKTEPISAYKSRPKGKTNRKTKSKTSKISKLTSLLENQSETLSYGYGHIIEYTCNEGYFKTTTGVLECTEEGWNNHAPQCHPITCPRPIQIKNGRVIWDDVRFRSVIHYECDEGYDLFGVSSRRCQANKDWTDIEPYCRPKECPRPANLINGRTIVKSIKYQSVISYVCDPGFRLEGDKTRICQSDENWSGERPFCIEIFCEEPPEIAHGVTDITSLKVGGQVHYSCMEGYRLEGRKTTLNCQSEGTWEGTPPQCVQIDCGSPPINSRVVIPEDVSTIYSSKVIYSCERGYQVNGKEWSTCLESGRWSNRAPTCNLVTCPPPSKIAHGYTVGEEPELAVDGEVEIFGRQRQGSPLPAPKGKLFTKSKRKGRQRSTKSMKYTSEKVYVVDDEVTYKCEPGWKAIGDVKLICTEDGQWSSPAPKCQRITCDPPRIPQHGKYSGKNFVYEGEVSFSCGKGYVLRGNPVLRCTEEGKWSDEPPICEPISCGDPPELQNSHVSYTVNPVHGLVHHYGSIITYACNEGYLLEGSLYMMCESSGKWIGPKEPPTCMEMLCGDPPNIPHASATEATNVRPQMATYTCDSGYLPSGDQSIYCSLGRWKGLNMTCNPVNCYEPAVPPYGKITAKHFMLGSVANYSCILGYELVGNPSVECGVDAIWIGEIPECRPVDCGKPENLPKGKYTHKSTIYGSTAEYECDEGYELKGESTRVCSHDGKWSGHLPQCHRVSCGELVPPSKGYVIGVGQLFGDEVKFTCEKGHVLIGEESSTCLADGNWSVTNPKCEGVKCGPPDFIRNGELLNVDLTEIFIFGDRIIHSCQKGHLPRGDLSTKCQKDGTWSAVRGQCSKISCGRPRINKDGAVILGRSFYYNDNVKITCPSGSKPKGNTLLTCLSDGSWSGEASCVSGCNGKCFNGGICLSDDLCSCPAGYIGKRCQYASCILPCLNGGTCVGPYKCQCVEGYGGHRCQSPICENSCGHGKCIGPNVCQCRYGITAQSCPDDTDYDYYSQQIETQFNDWDFAALRHKLERNHGN